MSISVVQPLQDWIATESRLLDMGCGNGEMLSWLREKLQVRGCGVEIDPQCIQHCLQARLDIVQQDMNLGLSIFTDNSFDTVLASDCLHYANQPARTLQEMLRIGQQAIVGFDNDGWWRRRISFVRNGRYLEDGANTRSIWYRQQQPRLFSIADFEDLCQSIDCEVLDRHFNSGSAASANFFASRAWYLLKGK